MPDTLTSNPGLAGESDGSEGLVAIEAAGDNSGVLSVSEISQAIKRSLETGFGFVRLRGELSGVKRAASGHLYCCLKDEGAVIDGVMWKSAAPRLAFAPEDGLEVVASGRITAYPGRSKYQIVIERMELAGEGALLALLEKTRARLAAEGLFDPAGKRDLPFAPGVIGVVTSPTGAVIRDILHRLADRFPVRVLVWPVQVQGPGAAGQVAAAVRGFDQLDEDGTVPRPDLVIVARGGGSNEDLWAFNEEEVVRAVAASRIPVISAVGHETDTSLCDHAADRRAPTPTAAAEMAVPVRRELAALVADLAHRQRRCALRPVELGRERLEARVRQLPRPQSLAQSASLALDERGERLVRGLATRVELARRALHDDRARLSLALLRARAAQAHDRLRASKLIPALLLRPMADARRDLAGLARLLGQLHPDRPLERGYAMVLDSSGAALSSRAEALRHARVDIRFADGVLPAAPMRHARAGGPTKAQLRARSDPSHQPKLL